MPIQCFFRRFEGLKRSLKIFQRSLKTLLHQKLCS